MEEIVYLDNSSTTKPCDEAVSAVLKAMSAHWGNPSSLHVLGMQAQNAVDIARDSVSSILGCRPDEIYFTGCGTESNNTAIIGGALARKKRGNRIVTTAVEHPSILEPMKALENQGFEVIKLKPDRDGKITPEKIANAVNDKTVLVSIMYVNNETGAIMPVECVKNIINNAKAPAIFHTDAVQAFGKIPINVNKVGADLLSVSAHKIHGPKGVGALYIKKGLTIKPILAGGGQERGMRSGTEGVPSICGFGSATDHIGNIDENLRYIKDLYCYAKQQLSDKIGAVINSSDEGLPYILNISVLGYRSETMLHFLEQSGIYVSSGSACSKGKGSYVLSEMGLDKKVIDSALRLSFSRFNTRGDIDRLVETLSKAKEVIRRAN